VSGINNEGNYAKKVSLEKPVKRNDLFMFRHQ
jgi:hypothetical protein